MLSHQKSKIMNIIIVILCGIAITTMFTINSSLIKFVASITIGIVFWGIFSFLTFAITFAKGNLNVTWRWAWLIGLFGFLVGSYCFVPSGMQAVVIDGQVHNTGMTFLNPFSTAYLFDERYSCKFELVNGNTKDGKSVEAVVDFTSLQNMQHSVLQQLAREGKDRKQIQKSLKYWLMQKFQNHASTITLDNALATAPFYIKVNESDKLFLASIGQQPSGSIFVRRFYAVM